MIPGTEQTMNQAAPAGIRKRWVGRAEDQATVYQLENTCCGSRRFLVQNDDLANDCITTEAEDERSRNRDWDF